jgi:putative nucleotidyltransferase with HDIG domain
VANASKYAKMVKSDTITDAIQLLGLEKVRDVALASSFMGNLLDPYSKGFDWQAFWEHSISVGIISSLIAKFLGREDFEKFYTAGLLHDMGKVGAFCLDEKNMLLVARKAREHKISMLQAELMTEAPRHDLLGHAICERWNLPEYIGQVCRNHHTVSRNQRNLSETDSQNEFIDVVILANHLVRKIGLGYSGHNSIENGIEEVLEYLGLDDQDLKEIEELAKNEIKQSGGMMELLA